MRGASCRNFRRAIGCLVTRQHLKYSAVACLIDAALNPFHRVVLMTNSKVISAYLKFRRLAQEGDDTKEKTARLATLIAEMRADIGRADSSLKSADLAELLRRSA